MGTPARSEAAALVAIAVLHLAVQVVHGYSHVAADVPLSAFQQLFILVVVTVAPLAAVYACWKMDMRAGAALFSLSMAAAFVFGYVCTSSSTAPTCMRTSPASTGAFSSIPPWDWR